jgi:peptidoglycan/LPS O-acetylase OafA/YrhL
MKPVYIPTLNGWRAIAVLLVIGAHSYTMLRNGGTTFGNFVALVLSHAGIGVDIFFAISGFLICTLLLREKEEDGSTDLTGFYIRRCFRILPPMWVYLLIVGVLSAISILNVKAFDIVSAALFLRNYVERSSWYADHFWSLAVEEHFYLFVPLLLSRLTRQSALRVSLSIVIGCALIRIAEFHLIDGKVEFHSEARIDAIMYGAIWAILRHAFQKELERSITPTVVFSVFVASLVLSSVFDYMPLRRTLMAATIPLPIIWTVLNSQSVIGRILESRPLQGIGKISYSLYIWQMMFLVPTIVRSAYYRVFPLPSQQFLDARR